jgi:hypothetical protein
MRHVACTLPGIEASFGGYMWIALSLEHWSFGALFVCSLYTTTTGGCPDSHASKIALQAPCGLHSLLWFEALLAGLFSLWATASSSAEIDRCAGRIMKACMKEREKI